MLPEIRGEDSKTETMTKTTVTGLVGLATIIVSVLLGATLGTYKLEHNFHDDIDSPVLALELARNGSDLQMVLGVGTGEQEHAISSLRANTILDLLFIPLYASFLWLFADLFSEKQRTLRKLAALSVLLAAVADYVEDFRMFIAMSSRELSDALARDIRYASLTKWALLGIALLLIAAILVRSSSGLYSFATRSLFGIAFGTAGALLLAGLWRPTLIELATKLFGLLFLLNTFGFLGPVVAAWFPGAIPEYVSDFCKQRAAGRAEVAVHARPIKKSNTSQ